MLFENLRRARETLGLSQEDVAKRIGVAQQTYSAFERGLKTPSVAVLMALADVLGATTDELLGRKENNNARQRRLL